MIPTKIVIIGAGSASFGLNTLATLMRSERLRGSHLALVDINSEMLELMAQVAGRINQEWFAEITITTHTDRKDALEGADFVVLSIEVSPREALWRSDLEIPLKYGVRQPYGENGGPGGFAHAARNIGPVMEIVHDMEKACPNALLINFTNPMMRICDAISRYSSIKVVGLCHQINVGYRMVGLMLSDYLSFENITSFKHTRAVSEGEEERRILRTQARARLDIQAAGINHFTWMLELHDKKTGENLYPNFRHLWESYDSNFEPLTRQIFRIFKLFPVPGDSHLSEYLPWVSDPVSKPWQRYDLIPPELDLAETNRELLYGEITQIVNRQKSIDHLRYVESEGALEIIENIAGGGTHYHDAVNLPNQGYISNLPKGAIVEVPGLISGAGVQGISVGSLPEPVAELCRREISVSRLCVDAAVNGDREAGLQCLLLDPVVNDIQVAELIFDDYLKIYQKHLSQFWK